MPNAHETPAQPHEAELEQARLSQEGQVALEGLQQQANEAHQVVMKPGSERRTMVLNASGNVMLPHEVAEVRQNGQR